MSEALRARIAVADAQYEAEGARQAQSRAELAAISEQDRIVASIQQAQDRGELVDVREAIRNGGVGRTKEEALAYFSARADIEDARSAGMARKVEREINEQLYGDTSAPTHAEQAEWAQIQERADKYRAKRRAEGRFIGLARTAARMDRERR
jgi:hypothetical protein